MTDPPPITACLSQAGPFRTAARLEIRTDGYFMEDIRELARSARGIVAPFAHPRLVSLGEFTTTRAITDAANAQTQWTVTEPAAIQQDMSTSNVNQQAPQPTNSWFNRPPPAPSNTWSPSSANTNNQTSPCTEHHPSPLSTSSTTSDEHLRPLPAQSGIPLPRHMGPTTHTSHPINSNTPPPPSQSSRGLSAQEWFGIPNPAQDTPLPPGSTTLPDNTAQHSDLGGPLGPTSSPLSPPFRSANDGLIGGQHWRGGTYAEHSSSSDAEGDNDDPAMDTSNHTAQDPLSPDPPTASATTDPPLSATELLQSAIEAARKAAKEESDKTIAELTARNQQATQILRDELQAQQLKFQQDLLAHTDATAQARTEELKRTMETRDQEQAKATQLLHQNFISHQEQIRAEDIRERLKEQAIQQDRQAKSDAIMESLAAFLSHTNVTAGNRISDTTPTTSSTRPTQSSTANIHGHDHQWFSDPSDLPAHWIHQQQES